MTSTGEHSLWQQTWQVDFHSNPLLPHLPRMHFIKRFLVTGPHYASDRHGPGFLNAPFFKYTLSGLGRLETGDGTYELPAGTGFLFRPDARPRPVFRYPRGAGRPWEWLHIAFWGCDALIRDIVERSGPVVTLPADDPLLQPFWRFALSGMQEHAISISCQDSARLVIDFLAGLAQHGHHQHAASRAQLLVEEAKALILELLHRRPQVKQVAGRLGVSPEHLNRIFRTETGITPLAFYQQALITRAKSLLMNPALSIKQLAHDLGFTGSAHFVALFSKQVGLSPNRYRAGRLRDSSGR